MKQSAARALPVVSDEVDFDPRAHGARCDLCPLKGNTVVPPKPSSLPTNAIFVGEAPGRREEVQGAPFVGMTGQFLRSICRQVDIDIRQVHLTNAAMCRSNIDKENEEAAVCCAPRLLRELAEFDPKIPIVTLGKTSTLSVLGVRSIMHARGFVWTARDVDPAGAWKAAKKARLNGAPKAKMLKLKAQIYEGRSKLGGRTVLPTIHPAFVLRSDTWNPILKIDMDRIGRWIRGELTAEMLVDNGPYVVVTKPKDVIRELAKLKPVISEDIETGASSDGGKDGANPNRNKILCVGVSDGEHTVVIWPWESKVHAPLLNRLHKRVRTISMHNGYCVYGNTLVMLADGTRRRISRIVNGREKPLVASMNARGEIEAARVVGWSKTRRSNQRWVRIKVAGGRLHGMTVTPDHRVFTARGWVEADRIRSTDKIAQPEPTFSPEMRAALIGTLLGDSSMRVRDRGVTANVTGGHAARSGLAQHKAAVMPFIRLGRSYTPRSNFANVSAVRPYKSGMSREVLALRPLLYDKAGRKRLLLSTVKQLGPIGFAWWFMDDGCLQKRRPNDRVSIATNCFDIEDVRRVARWFSVEFGATWACASSGVLALSASAAEQFCAYIAPHVPPKMRYKFPRQYTWPKYVDLKFEFSSKPQLARVVDIDRNYRTACWATRSGKHLGTTRYCLVVEKNRNFFTANGLVHNCFDQIALARADVPYEDIEDKLEDTLIAHHTFASHMPQRLSHVASVFLDVGPWKITFKRGKDGASEKGLPPEQLDPKDLVKYNAADARIQARTWLAMQADLESELSIYEVDKDNARLCRSMVINGIGVDLERRDWLRGEMVKKEEDLLEKMRKILKRPDFHPMQLNEVRRALFTTLRAPLSAADPTNTGVPSTSQKTLERLKSSPTRAGKFADYMLQWRGVTKIRGTYLDSQVLDKPSKKHPKFAKTHFNWKSYGAASGRYSGRLQSCPRAEYLKDKSIVVETRVRELYVAEPGTKLVYFDLSQAELRFAAYLSGDKQFVAACESGDVHTATAMKLFPADAELIKADPKGAGKPFRDTEKNSIFGFIYYAEPQTIFTFLRSKGMPVEFRDVLSMHDMVHDTFADYFRYVEHNKRWVDKHGYLRCALSGRISWLGWHTGISDVANRPIQGGIASLMNVRLPRIVRALPRGGKLVAQVHDAAIMQVPERSVEGVRALVKKAWKEPVVIPANGFGSSTRIEDGARHFVMPIDDKVGERWSDFG